MHSYVTSTVQKQCQPDEVRSGWLPGWGGIYFVLLLQSHSWVKATLSAFSHLVLAGTIVISGMYKDSMSHQHRLP